MNVIYVAVYDNNPNSGVTKKIVSQVDQLKKLGITVLLVLVCREPPVLSCANGAFIERASTPPFLSFAEKIKFAVQYSRIIIRYLNRGDILYVRGIVASPLTPFLLRKKRNTAIVYELQGISENEAKLRGSRMGYVLAKLLHKYLLRTARGIVGVTEEVTHHYAKIAGQKGMRVLTNPNGIDVDAVRLRILPSFDGQTLDLLCVARVAKWHGLDRIIKGISEYKGRVNVRFHVVGDGSEIPNLKSLVADLKLENSVVFHGFKTGKELDSFFDKCHIAVSSLAIHRAGAGSPLKSKEYCARGIPFVDSTTDEDFDPQFEFRMKIRSEENPINIEQIVEFAGRVLRDSDHHEKMRKYAIERLDWSIKMKRLKDFFEEIVKS